ncbi:hypothetical protein BDP55DRAFT_683649 [Colletotrichum godetiae]|uniref:Invertebrate defensins family profile domain-containing protein n=1 Tax=Colletotrichum godetiae TaxID=1209918 RepID=A0AAJ0ABX8_9PEZI|nr:uncharacterized protein BDP55DRAFT_683649 [Colletotrichum godetiae]KAK1658165.1 hypothetical protein BDP55DRAFT_683649 [Colletotrichum godetiae]
MLYSYLVWAAALVTCNASFVNELCIKDAAMSNLEYDLRYGCDIWEWKEGFEGGCAAACKRQGKQGNCGGTETNASECACS